MPTQKFMKNNKLQTKNTLDIKHQEFNENFYKQDKFIIPELLFNRKLLYDEYNYCNIDEKIDIKFYIDIIDRKIKSLKKEKI